MGDVLSDLPVVTNYTTAEAAKYATAPKTPYQMWLRRQPPTWQASPAERARRADEAMLPSQLDQSHKRDILTLLPGAEEAVRGRLYPSCATQWHACHASFLQVDYKRLKS